jgi:hypothetical protein
MLFNRRSVLAGALLPLVPVPVDTANCRLQAMVAHIANVLASRVGDQQGSPPAPAVPSSPRLPAHSPNGTYVTEFAGPSWLATRSKSQEHLSSIYPAMEILGRTATSSFQDVAKAARPSSLPSNDCAIPIPSSCDLGDQAQFARRLGHRQLACGTERTRLTPLAKS